MVKLLVELSGLIISWIVWSDYQNLGDEYEVSHPWTFRYSRSFTKWIHTHTHRREEWIQPLFIPCV